MITYLSGRTDELMDSTKT